MEQESPRGARPYVDEAERRQRLQQGRNALQAQPGSEPQPSGQGIGQMPDHPPPPLGQFSSRSSMPSISSHSSSQLAQQQPQQQAQPPALRKGGSSIGSTGPGGSMGSASWQGSQWSSSIGWRQDSGSMYTRGSQPGTSIGNTPVGGPSIGAGGFGGPPPLGRSSINQGMIGARQSQMGSFGGHLGLLRPRTRLGQPRLWQQSDRGRPASAAEAPRLC